MTQKKGGKSGSASKPKGRTDADDDTALASISNNTSSSGDQGSVKPNGAKTPSASSSEGSDIEDDSDTSMEEESTATNSPDSHSGCKRNDSKSQMPSSFSYVPAQQLLVSAVEYNNYQHLVLPISLTVNGRTVSLCAMIDSGATGNFINGSVIRKYGLPTEKLAQPKALAVVDGRPIEAGRVTHCTPEMRLSTDNHNEDISLWITSLGRHDVILGLPWLEANNPRIDWNARTIRWTKSGPTSALPARPPRSELSTVEIASISLEQAKRISREDMECCVLLHVRFSASSELEISAMTGDDVGDNNDIPEEFREFADVFSKTNAEQLPEHSKYDHHIDVEEGKTPPFGRLYNLSETELKALDAYLRENLSRGFIRASNSPAGAPVLFVKKKDGSLRLCVDYRRLNDITVKNRYPLPLIQESLDRLRDAKWFSKIDLRGAYNLIRVAEGDEWKTAFRTRYGLFEYNVMPFGLTNAPATFQRMINEVMRDFLDVKVIVYLDDIMVFSRTRRQHIDDVKAVLQRLREHHLWAKPEKCQFFRKSVEFLGFVISRAGISMDPAKVEAVLQWPAPKTVKDVRAFLGFANFYRRFIAKYSGIVAPLVQLTRETTPWEWTTARQAAFDALKVAFTSAPILTHYDPGRKIVVETDASDYAIAGVISHPDDRERLQPIAFYSRKLDTPEQNYTVCDKELLAIVEAFRQWRAYTEGAAQRIDVYCDHRNLQYFRTTQVLSRRQTRWSEALAGFDFQILHKEGSAMGKPDALTRRYDYRLGARAGDKKARHLFKPGQFACAVELAATEEDDLTSHLRDAQAQDETCKKLLATAPEYAEGSKRQYAIRDGLLTKRGRIVVPDVHSLKLDVLDSLHDGRVNAHPGQKKTFAMVSRHYDFPGMRNFVNVYVRGCHGCTRDKSTHHKRYGKLQPLPIPDRPWQSISMDAIVKLPLSSGCDSILTVVDRFSKMAHFIPFKEQGFDAPALARLFQHHIFRLHGVPADIVSDRGATFNSKFWRAFTSGLGTKCNFSTAFHPQTDGQTERVNQIVEQYLRICCNEAQDNWADLLDTAEFQYNKQKHESTGMSPFELVTGQHPNHPAVSLPSPNPAAGSRLEDLVTLQLKAKRSLKIAQETAKRYYDRGSIHPPTFNVGDQVWVSMKNWIPRRPNKKLDHKFAGPYRVMERISPLVYRIDLPPTLSVHPTLPVALLQPYHEGHEGQRQPMPPQLLVDNEEQCVPERLLDSRQGENGVEFLVKWEGQGEEENTWEDFDNLSHLRALLLHFRKSHPSKPFPKSAAKRAPAPTAQKSRRRPGEGR